MNGQLEAENTQLREEIERLRAILYPPPPPPEKADDHRRYLLGSPREQEPWRTFDESMIDCAFKYARESHPDLQFVRAHRWNHIPEGAIYTTVRAAWDARQAKTEVPFYEISRRNSALDAIKDQRGRIRAREDELISRPNSPTLDWHRVWVYRWRLLDEASSRLNRPFEIACWPLADYREVIQAATNMVDEALLRDSELKIADVPGYRPSGSWTCEKCGYPYLDTEALKGGDVFCCRACRVADPQNGKHQAKWVEELRAKGNDGTANKLEQNWQAAVDGASSPEIPDFVERPCRV